MPPKKKQGGSKSRSPRKSKATTIVDGLSTAEMTHEQLEEHIMRLRAELERERQERNYFHLEKDKITNFWEITKRKLEECSSELRNKERELEEAEDRHQLELKVYRQKVKHLLFEKTNEAATLISDASTALKIADEKQLHVEKQMRHTALNLKSEIRENQVKNHIGVLDLTKDYERKIHDIREDFSNQIDEQRRLYENKLRKLEEQLNLQRRNELHDIEERKNNHVAYLMKNQEKALTDMKAYYKDITASNLSLITSLKEELAKKQTRIEQLESQISEVKQENRKLVDPLKLAQEENKELKRKMTNYSKDMKFLEITKTKLNSSEKQRKNSEWQVEILKQRFEQLEKERDDLYEKFVSAIQEVQQKTGLKNLLLEKRLKALSESIEKKEVQLCEVLAASHLDSISAKAVTQKVEEILNSKNSAIRELQYELARVCKAHNDLVDACEIKLQQFGIPVEELGFQPIKTVLCTSDLGKNPAGLVSVPP